MARSRGTRETSGEEPNRVLGFPLRGGPGEHGGQGGKSGQGDHGGQGGKIGQGDHGGQGGKSSVHGGTVGQSARQDAESAAGQDIAPPQTGRGAASGNGAEPQRVLGIPLTWFTALGRKRIS